MKTLFSQLYNRILELFQKEKSENTGECAANRLQVILMHDRTKLDPLIMGKMREELIEVFSKYVVIDKEKLEIDLTNEGDAAALMLSIPIVRAKTEEELEELRKKLQEEENKIVEEDESIQNNEIITDEIIEEVNQEAGEQAGEQAEIKMQAEEQIITEEENT